MIGLLLLFLYVVGVTFCMAVRNIAERKLGLTLDSVVRFSFVWLWPLFPLFMLHTRLGLYLGKRKVRRVLAKISKESEAARKFAEQVTEIMEKLEND